MGGRLEIDTAPGRGTRVSIWAPRRQGDGKPQHRRSGPPRATSGLFTRNIDMTGKSNLHNGSGRNIGSC